MSDKMTSDAPHKRPYQEPKLLRFGNVDELTQGNSNVGMMDAVIGGKT